MGGIDGEKRVTHTAYQRGRRAAERGYTGDIPYDLVCDASAMAEWERGYDSVNGASDPVNHPSHYTSHPSGVESIEMTRWLRGPYSNALKYVLRGWNGLKDDPIQDLEKALWYLDDAYEYIALNSQEINELCKDAFKRWDNHEPDREFSLCVDLILEASQENGYDAAASLSEAIGVIEDRINKLHHII